MEIESKIYLSLEQYLDPFIAEARKKSKSNDIGRLLHRELEIMEMMQVTG